MTGLKPLEYGAALAVFGFVIAYLVALEFSARVRQESRLLYAVPLQVLMFLAGKSIGLAAVAASLGVQVLHALVELWSTQWAAVPAAWHKSLARYRDRQFHRGAHRSMA